MPEYAVFVSELEEFKGIVAALKMWHKDTNPLHFDCFLEGVVRPYTDKTRFGYYVKGNFVIIIRTHSVEVEDLEKLNGVWEVKEDRLMEYINKDYLVPLDDRRFGVVARLATRKSINWEHINHHIIDESMPLLDSCGRINGTNYQLPTAPIPEREQLPISYWDLVSIVSKLERDLERNPDPKERTHSIVAYTLATISCFTGKDAVVIAPKELCINGCWEHKVDDDGNKIGESVPVENPYVGEPKEGVSHRSTLDYKDGVWTQTIQDCAGNLLDVPAEQPKKRVVRRVKKETA